MSVVTGNYRPKCETLCSWLNWEFNYSVDANVSQDNI